MANRTPVDDDIDARLHARWRVLLVQGVGMIALGALAVALPVVTTFEIATLSGWLLLAGGAWRAIHGIRAGNAPGFGWSLALGSVAMAFGLLLLATPLAGVNTLLFVLAAFFLLEGIGKTLLAFELRRHARAGSWTLASGAADLVLAVLVFSGWASSAAWAVGLVGINMTIFGVSLTAVALAARRARHHVLERIATGSLYVPPQESRPA